MTHKEVLDFLIKFLKDVNAVNPRLSDDKIALVKLPDLAWFDMQLDADPDFKKDALFMRMVKDFKKEFDGIPPHISPFGGEVFDQKITVSKLAKKIADKT